MADTSAFSKLVPGFDFLQDLVKNAGAALPSMGQWVAPTLNPEELEKRIEELKTVQFWLEQNARMLGATIQALEVQRMTLSTLKTMNVQMGELRDSMKLRVPEPAAAPGKAAVDDAAHEDEDDDTSDDTGADEAADTPAAGQAAAALPPGVVDPMQWWGALTKQFTALAANAVKESAADAVKHVASAMVKQGFEAATDNFKKAAAMPAAAVRKAAGVASPTASAKTSAKPSAKAAAGKTATARPAKRTAAPPASRSPRRKST